MRYHINSTGDPRLCSARTRACPYGGESGSENHFESVEEARKHVEDEMSESTLVSFNKGVALIPGEITLSSNIGTFDVTNGDLDNPNARLALSSGLCGGLALAIHKISKSDFYFVTMHMNETEDSLRKHFEEDPNYVFGSNHVLARSLTDPDAFIDSYGHKSREEIEEFYDGAIIVKGTPEMAERFAGSDHENLNEFALAALKLDKEQISYDYEDFEIDNEDDDWGDEYED